MLFNERNVHTMTSHRMPHLFLHQAGTGFAPLDIPTISYSQGPIAYCLRSPWRRTTALCSWHDTVPAPLAQLPATLRAGGPMHLVDPLSD
jgi:hypothetical protein